MSSESAPAVPPFAIEKARTRLFGLTLDECIHAFFGGSACMAVVVLTLITVFLFREGADFFGKNHDNLRIYRQAGLEYVDYIRQQERDHTALTRYLSDLRLRTLRYLTAEKGLTVAQANARLAGFDDFAGRYGDAVEPVRGLVSDLTETATAIKTKYTVNEDAKEGRRQLLAEGKKDEAAAITIQDVDFKTELAPITGTLPLYKEASATFSKNLGEIVAGAPVLPAPELQARMVKFQELTRDYLATFPETLHALEQWDYAKPVPFTQAFTAFFFGHEWLTASFWQDWYGVVPLLVGSLLVSVIALCLAVPLGVGAAIYVNQIASPREQKLIKPAIEFISAIPSVVLGFFGIAVLGQTLRAISQVAWLDWIPGFPFAERLNALTAGCLLALIAVPTIFTLAEDAINNVPRAFKEASFALGASRMQTIIRIIVPASLSGIVSAVLLGLGRVVGETMVVLLCAGNRIAIPDFTAGLAVVTQPVHTMTGIIAQEMGEVVRGSIHYRALFVVGIVLFFLALLINFLAQKIVRKYRISIG
ncbi:MAG: phosphate ABC transporter permease subunit PstC [Verrucomicrobia bacterium]|nr:phosphate ABC transporter permease subunit PstC [Verrucomicrobiota bacterium]